MSDQDQRCGTCKYYEAGGEGYRGAKPEDGWCTAPVPDSVDSDFREPMLPKQGTTCPCWAPIGNGEGGK